MSEQATSGRTCCYCADRDHPTPPPAVYRVEHTRWGTIGHACARCALDVDDTCALIPLVYRRQVDYPCIGARSWNGIGTIRIMAAYQGSGR